MGSISQYSVLGSLLGYENKKWKCKEESWHFTHSTCKMQYIQVKVTILLFGNTWSYINKHEINVLIAIVWILIVPQRSMCLHVALLGGGGTFKSWNSVHSFIEWKDCGILIYSSLLYQPWGEWASSTTCSCHDILLDTGPNIMDWNLKAVSQNNVLAVLEIELRALNLLHSCSITSATLQPPYNYYLLISWISQVLL
jgi:hypothetical protein